jgi:enoyl-[acyl-carrier protein] reductase I
MAHNLLAGKKGIITGALDEQSIAWKVAEQAHAEGAELILSNAPVALRMGSLQQLGEKINAEVVPADATNLDDIGQLYDKAADQFGRVDFLLHAIGMSPNVRKGRDYTNLKYDWLAKTLDISATSFHKMMQLAYQRDLFNEWGSIVGLSYIAAQRAFPKYNDMSEAKALLESYARTFGYYFGVEKNVRVNTVSQSPTPTTAGSGIAGFQEMLNFAEQMSPLGNASADDCAAFIVMLFSDYTRKVTMQNLFHDGGFSNTGLTPEVLAKFSGDANSS